MGVGGLGESIKKGNSVIKIFFNEVFFGGGDSIQLDLVRYEQGKGWGFTEGTKFGPKFVKRDNRDTSI